jgi:resuscitation-promoting factor RpfA
MSGIESGLALLDRALAPAGAALGVLLVLRIAVPALLAAAARLPGAFGRSATRLGRWLRPGLARRLLAVVVGLAAPVVAWAPSASARASEPVAASTAVGAGSREAGAAHREAPSGQATARTVVVRHGDTLWDIARRHLPPGAGAGEIARAWPRWYAANRRVIGPDPNLIVPGMRLRVPVARLITEASPRPAGTPAQHHRPASHHVDASSLDPDRR